MMSVVTYNMTNGSGPMGPKPESHGAKGLTPHENKQASRSRARRGKIWESDGRPVLRRFWVFARTPVCTRERALCTCGWRLGAGCSWMPGRDLFGARMYFAWVLGRRCLR
jgi:hypothetical protein